jgi:hypothetical protein
VYETSSPDVAVASLNATVGGAMEQANPRGYNCKSKLQLDCFCDKFAFYRKLVKTLSRTVGLDG